MKSNLSTFIKRNAVIVLFVLLVIAALLLRGWTSTPVPGAQWKANMEISTPTPTISLVAPGWWDSIQAPTPEIKPKPTPKTKP